MEARNEVLKETQGLLDQYFMSIMEEKIANWNLPIPNRSDPKDTKINRIFPIYLDKIGFYLNASSKNKKVGMCRIE